MKSTHACIVIPCYNEADRLQVDALIALARHDSVQLLLVDDGSTDGTREILGSLAREQGIETLVLDQNCGKGEAVRAGLVHALADGVSLVGYYDADLATPPGELVRLVQVLMSHPEIQCAMGSRIAFLGATIERRAFRHYVGRVFASVASVALGIPVYDTQCGAKVFRAAPALAAAVAEPFRSRWAFDVELLDRLMRGSATVTPVATQAFLEVPLREWRDVPGSQLNVAGAAAALADVCRIGIARRLRRRE